MKKGLIILVVATFGWMACNSSADGKTDKDSTKVLVDTPALAPADTAITMDTLAPVTVDSTIKK